MGKAAKVHFSVAIVLCDIYVQSAYTLLNSRGEDDLSNLAIKPFGVTILRSFVSEATRCACIANKHFHMPTKHRKVHIENIW